MLKKCMQKWFKWFPAALSDAPARLRIILGASTLLAVAPYAALSLCALRRLEARLIVDAVPPLLGGITVHVSRMVRGTRRHTGGRGARAGPFATTRARATCLFAKSEPSPTVFFAFLRMPGVLDPALLLRAAGCGDELYDEDDEIFAPGGGGWRLPATPDETEGSSGDDEALPLGAVFGWAELEAPPPYSPASESTEEDGCDGACARAAPSLARAHAYAPPPGPRTAGGSRCACARADASHGTRPPALAVFLEPRGRAAATAAAKPRNSSKMSFGDLVLQPKAAAVAAGFTTKNGKKTQVKSGYRGVRQRPWGAPPRLPRAGTVACVVAPRARRVSVPLADTPVVAGKFAAEIRDPQHSTRLWLVRDTCCVGAQAPVSLFARACTGAARIR